MKIVAVEDGELGVILTREEAEIIAAFLFTVIAGDTEERMICIGMSSELRNVAKVNASVFKFQKLANHPIALTIHKCD